MSAFVLGATVAFRTRRTAPVLGATLTAGVVWAAAFAVTWASRWVLALVLLA